MTERHERNVALAIKGLTVVLVLLVLALILQIIILDDEIVATEVASITAISGGLLACIGALSVVTKRGRDDG